MADNGPVPPLARRVPGASGSGPAPRLQPKPKAALSDALVRRMRAAIRAARAEQGKPARAQPPRRDPAHGDPGGTGPGDTGRAS